MKRVEVLIAAMHLKNEDAVKLAERTGIRSDAILINQCDREESFSSDLGGNTFRCVSTKERGLSRSRNMALDNARGDLCLICDDDETLLPDYAETIAEAFEKHPHVDVMCFQVERPQKVYPAKEMKIGYLKSLKVMSVQIVLNRESIDEKKVRFDVNYGSGTKAGSGEENIFLFDCLRAGLNIYYVPKCIGSVTQTNSHWFKGFTEEYFLNRGNIINRMMGKGWGRLYCLYFAMSKYPRYHKNLSLFRVWHLMMKGMSQKYEENTGNI